MAKTSRLVARQATAMESMEGLLAEVIERLERIEQKLSETAQPKPAAQAAKKETTGK